MVSTLPIVVMLLTLLMMKLTMEMVCENEKALPEDPLPDNESPFPQIPLRYGKKH